MVPVEFIVWPFLIVPFGKCSGIIQWHTGQTIIPSVCKHIIQFFWRCSVIPQVFLLGVLERKMHTLFHPNGFIAHCAGFIKITSCHMPHAVSRYIIRQKLILAAQKFFNLPFFKCAAVICTVFRVNIPIVLPGDHAVFIVIRQLFLNLSIVGISAACPEHHLSFESASRSVRLH